MRRIVCQKCTDKHHSRGLHPEDEANGWMRRLVPVKVKKPADHAITILGDGTTKTEALPSILCDDCGDAIADGTIATAISMWRGGELAAWEHEYGTPIQ